MKAKTVEEYSQSVPQNAKEHFDILRSTLRQLVSEAEESLKWGIPALSLHRVLFAYAAYKNHVALYPTPSAINKFSKDLKQYQTGKGSIKFPLDSNLPIALITKIAKFRVKELTENDARWM